MKHRQCYSHPARQDFVHAVDFQTGLIYKFERRGHHYIHTFVSGQLGSIFSDPPNAYIGKPLSDMFPGPLADTLLPYYKTAWKGDSVGFTGSYGHVRFHGTFRPVIEDSRVIEVIAMLAPLADGQLQLPAAGTETAARAVPPELESYMDQWTDAAMISDKQGVILKINPAFTAMFGWEPSEIVGTLLPMIQSHRLPNARHILDSLLLGKRIPALEVVFQNKEGKLFPALVHLNAFLNEDGEVAGIIGTARDVSERNRMRSELASSVHRYELITRYMSDLLLIFDPSGNVLQSSPSYEKLFGSPPVKGKKLDLEVHPDDREAVKQVFKRAVAEKTPHSMEFRHHRGTGWVVLDAKISPMPDEAGEVKSVLVVARDITERKLAERALQEAEEKYRNLVEEALVGVYLFSENKIVYANPKFADIFGYRIDEIYSIDPYSLIADEVRPAITERISNGIQSGHLDLNLQIKGMRKNGSPVHIETSGKYLFYNGKPAITGTVQDVTERKRVEEIVRESNQRYRRLLDLNPEPIIVHSNGVIVYSNEAFLPLVHAASMSEVIGTSIFDYLHPDCHAQARCRIQEANGTKSNWEHNEYTLIGKNGQVKKIETSSISIDKLLGTTVVQTVLRDITERKKTEEILRRSDKLSALGQMAAGIAHEIRNPLTSLKGFVQLLQSKVGGHPLYFDIMLSELERINYIVTEFMKIAKPEHTEYQSKNIAFILQNIISLMTPQALLYNIELRLVAPDGLPPVFCDENQLKQLFINVLKNAIEAMNGGGVIAIDVTSEAGMLNVRIQDQGPGIPPDVLSRLGDPFYTTKSSGTGLGLMVCFKIVETHRGNMYITSEPGQGAVVHIALPAQQVADSPA